MAYIPKIIAPEETLIGIARCHWIYVIKGLVWFGIMALAGWGINKVIMTFAFMLANWADNPAAPLLFMNLASGALWICLGAGLLVFFFLVLKVLVTEVGLSNRRILLKEGLLFVKVQQVDLEEIRGENLDLGHLGRLLGYGYLNLDCRFIGDVKLPAIENPEGFLNALHMARAKTQDAVSIIVGKGEKSKVEQVVAAPVEGVDNPPSTPQQQPAQPVPEIQPGQQPQPEVQPQPTTPTFPESPEIPTMPTPHNPPPQTAPPSQPEQTPPPAQPVPAPANPEPPLQPPSGQAQAASLPQPPSQPQQATQQAPQQQPVVDPAAVAQAMEQVMPHMVQEVVKQMAEQGLLPNKDTANDDDIDTDLISSFDEASEEGSAHALRNKVEHAIH